MLITDYMNQSMNSQSVYPVKDIPYAMDTQKSYTNIPQQQMLQTNMAVFSQPVVQDMALQYGSQVVFFVVSLLNFFNTQF